LRGEKCAVLDNLLEYDEIRLVILAGCWANFGDRPKSARIGRRVLRMQR
jgi:hypothetical protein